MSLIITTGWDCEGHNYLQHTCGNGVAKKVMKLGTEFDLQSYPVVLINGHVFRNGTLDRDN